MRPPTAAPHRRARRMALATTLLLGLAAPAAARPGAPASPVAAVRATAPAAPSTLAPASPDLPGLPGVSPILAEVAVDSAALRRARVAYDAVDARLAAAQGQRVAIDRAVAELTRTERRARAELTAARAQAEAATRRLEDLDAALAALAVELYTAGGPNDRVEAALSSEQPSIADADRRDVLGSASLDVLLAERQAYVTRLADAEERLAAAGEAVTAASAALAGHAADRPAAVAAEEHAAPAVAGERVRYEEARTLATISGVEFPLVALDAYHRAATLISAEDPACGVRWWAIAGISRVEGRHGTYGGSALDLRGDTTKRIIGIQLNGTNNTRVVHDTDGGALDGDPAYDRAVGPMQFIPETWGRFAADGNADGVATPFNLYDATLAAARYLCRASGGLDADPGLRAAYFAYNHSESYVSSVLSFARRYERAVEVPDPRD